MHYLYILFSAEKNGYYIGSTSDVASRLRRHLSSHKGYTGQVKDWVVVYVEEHDSKIEAMHRERLIKAWKSSKMIADLIAKKDL
jgi:putative endonuclease